MLAGGSKKACTFSVAQGRGPPAEFVGALVLLARDVLDLPVVEEVEPRAGVPVKVAESGVLDLPAAVDLLDDELRVAPDLDALRAERVRLF